MPTASGPKIVMVGGGSYNWSPRLLSDMLQTPELDGSRVVLLDPNTKAAAEIAAAGHTMARTLGRRLRLSTTADPAAGLRGADFVLITISTGGLAAMAHDLAVPEKYGIYHTVGDTAGPGGWSRALRNLPVFERLGAQLARYAPRALVLNYTNPMAILTTALAQACPNPVVGLCHGVFENYAVLQRIFGVEERDLAVTFAGLNHFFWFLDFRVKGQPGYPLLRARLGDAGLAEVAYAGTTDAMGHHSRHVLASELFRQYGYLPYVADRHICEFLPGVISPTPAALERYQLRRTTIAHRQTGLDGQRGVARELAAGQREPFPRSRESAVDLICARLTNRPFVDVMNLPNAGQIDNLPRGVAVETLGQVDALGFRPLAVGRLPPLLEHLVAPHCRCLQATLAAARARSRQLAVDALLLDPAVAHLPPREVRALGADLLAATAPWLKEYR